MSGEIFTGIVVLVIGLFIAGWSFGEKMVMGKMETQAISRGYALYCPDNGKFAWVGECDEN